AAHAVLSVPRTALCLQPGAVVDLARCDLLLSARVRDTPVVLVDCRRRDGSACDAGQIFFHLPCARVGGRSVVAPGALDLSALALALYFRSDRTCLARATSAVARRKRSADLWLRL